MAIQPGMFVLGSLECGDLMLEVCGCVCVFDSVNVTSSRTVFIDASAVYICVCACTFCECVCVSHRRPWGNSLI